ncbi:unnamed protein product [Chironomus riparius]|uniref:Phosphatidylethanolamine-binding protein n=1 Tax=Chironomus riparius TaxID=315576 RepID=A0A9N9RND9_9DIPT|nr:unnamed protein product [Chironomus riparius]
MFKKLLFSFIVLINLYNKCEGGSELVQKRLREDEIVPDVLQKLSDVDFLKVSYLKNSKADLGNILTPTQVKEQPEIEYDANPNDFYTLLMTDPDAPSRMEPTFREFRHWLVVNIPGNDIENGETVIEYIGSGPPKDTGLHRYVFLVFKQSKGKIDFDGPYVSNHSPLSRPSTSTRDLIDKYDLELVAANFFEAEYDDYVPTVHFQLSGKSG